MQFHNSQLKPGKLYRINWKKINGQWRNSTNLFYWRDKDNTGREYGTGIDGAGQIGHNENKIFLYLGSGANLEDKETYHIFLYENIRIYFETFINSKPEKWLVELVDNIKSTA